jgi:hypothetical protein
VFLSALKGTLPVSALPPKDNKAYGKGIYCLARKGRLAKQKIRLEVSTGLSS